MVGKVFRRMVTPLEYVHYGVRLVCGTCVLELFLGNAVSYLGSADVKPCSEPLMAYMLGVS